MIMFSYISNPITYPHAWLKSYTQWLVHRQIYLVYVHYMFTYILQYVSWRVDRFTVQKSSSKAAGLQLKCGAFTVRNNARKQHTSKELNLYLRRYNTARVLSFKSSKTPLVMHKCCCRSVKLNKVSMGFFFW